MKYAILRNCSFAQLQQGTAHTAGSRMNQDVQAGSQGKILEEPKQ